MDYFTGDIEIDNEILQNILETKKFHTGTNRRMMLKNGTGKYPTKDQISATFGLTRRGQLCPSNNYREESPYYGWYYTKNYSENLDLIPIFRDLLISFGLKFKSIIIFKPQVIVTHLIKEVVI